MVKVLVVDDDPDVRYLIKSILNSRDVDVVEARSGEDCLRILEDLTPDMILLDIMMPGIDGWEVLKRIRGDGRLRAVQVAMLTSLDPTVDDMMRKEFDTLADYILKPNLHEDLMAKFKHAQKPVVKVKA